MNEAVRVSVNQNHTPGVVVRVPDFGIARGEDGLSAYEQAVMGGYTGSEAQFNEELASFKTLHDETITAASHYPQIINSYWYVWDVSTGAYVNTGVKAEGEGGSDDIFMAKYGHTTEAELVAALNAGKQIYAKNNHTPPSIYTLSKAVFRLDSYGNFGYTFSFSRLEGSTLQRIRCDMGLWSELDNIVLASSDDIPSLSPYRTAAAQDVIDNGKQPTLVSGENIKTINGNSILGSGDLPIQGVGGVTEVNGQTGAVELDAEDVGALPDSSTLDDIPDGSTYKRPTGVQLQQIATNAADVQTQSGEIDQLQADVDAIEQKIPNQASSTNKLADKAFVNSSINSAAAFFRGAFPTRAALFAVAWQTTDPQAGNFVSNNDYAYVADDETHSDEAWRYIYVFQPGGTGNGWQPQFRVNESPLTAAQIAALNSGATAALIEQIRTNAAAIALKQQTINAYGILKGGGGGQVSAAVAGTDYQAPLTAGTDYATPAQVNAKYSKPAGGIPATDMAQAVQTSLDKADTALQEHQSLAAYRTAAAQDVIDAGKLTAPAAGSVGQILEKGSSGPVWADRSPVVTVSGTTPTITALPGVRYVCGEVTTLDITLPASGCIDVVFESGSTATVLTITPPTGVTLKWSNGFDPTSLDANTTYEINIMDGLGVAASWT